MKNLFKSLFFILISHAGLAQQLPHYSQRESGEYLINPAVTGAKKMLDARTIYRTQWVGFEGAPKTKAAIIHGNFLGGRLGGGSFFYQDKIGPTLRNNFGASLAYHVRFPDMQLSFGLAGGLLHYRVDGSLITIHNSGDQSIDRSVVDVMKAFNLSAGAYLHNDRFHMGISMVNMQNKDLKLYDTDSLKQGNIRLVPHEYLSLGYLYSNDGDFIFDNSIIAANVSGTPITLDYMLKMFYREKFFVGTGLRLGDAIVLQTGAILGDIEFSYSYDYVLSPIKKGSSGSHEIMIGYRTNFDGMSSKRNRFPEFQRQKYHL